MNALNNFVNGYFKIKILKMKLNINFYHIMFLFLNINYDIAYFFFILQLFIETWYFYFQCLFMIYLKYVQSLDIHKSYYNIIMLILLLKLVNYIFAFG